MKKIVNLNQVNRLQKFFAPCYKSHVLRDNVKTGSKYIMLPDKEDKKQENFLLVYLTGNLNGRCEYFGDRGFGGREILDRWDVMEPRFRSFHVDLRIMSKIINRLS